MKKISAIFLALVMILALAVTPAFAATTAVSFNTDVERDIEAYQLMTASVSGDMYAYVVSDKYSAVLIDVLGLNMMLGCGSVVVACSFVIMLLCGRLHRRDFGNV